MSALFVQFDAVIATQTEGNTNESRWARANRAKKQKRAAWLPCYVLDRVAWCGPRRHPAWNAKIKGALAPFVSVTVPLRVTMTRVSAGTLDSDGCVSSQKHVRDGIADALDINDRSPLIEWVCLQRRGPRLACYTEVRIEPRSP